MDYNNIINRTIHLYYVDRRREFNFLNEKLKTCSCFPTRRKVKARLEELSVILSKDYLSVKAGLVHTLNVKYKDLEKYPEMIEISRKSQILKRAIL